MKSKAAFAASLARFAPVLLAVLGLSAAVLVGCGVAEEDDTGISEDGVSCQYGYGYGCYGYGYRD
jgi:hypothetical protein